MDSNRENISQALFNSIEGYNKPEFIAFLKEDTGKNEILSSNPHMLMIMWLMSAQYDAEKASNIPFLLQDRLGCIKMPFLDSLPLEEIERAMIYPTKIHRFPKKRAYYLWHMARLIVTKYNGNPANIWANSSSSEISRRLSEIKGFGPKLSSMVPINLIRNFNMVLAEIEKMDVAVDVHVARVLCRTGLCHHDDGYDIMANTVRELAQSTGRYPMELDLPLWATGRWFCHAHAPNCCACPLHASCPNLPIGNSSNDNCLACRKGVQ